ncbi:hypothetical protein [Sodalis-like endosymbiont of Proechinophthirus fluctus]|nr:hypothetical protein [Sodalis-like endosymbiont of Proechinophthirus fluctus]
MGITSLIGANIVTSLTARNQDLYQAKYQGRNAVKFTGLSEGEK